MVITIIGILIALLLPAVQAAREAARRTQCANQLKQISLGCLNHEFTHGYLPADGWGYKWIGDPDRGFGRSQPGGWMFSLLPYIEQESIWLQGQGQSGAARSEAIRQQLTSPVATFYCPSRRPVGLYEQRSRDNSSGQWVYNHADDPGYIADVVKADYGLNYGTVPLPNSYHAGPGSAASFPGHNFPDSSIATGLAWWATEFPLATVKDGLSNTALIGEKAFDAKRADEWEAGDPQNAYIGHDPENGRYGGPDFPMMPDHDTVAVPAFYYGSPHPGGVQFAMCDGSVHTVSFSIDLQTLSYLVNRKDGQQFSLSN